MLGRMDMLTKILELLKRTGITQAQLEDRARISKNRISKWKDPEQNVVITADEAFRMASVLGVPVDFLLDESQTEVPKPLAADEVAVLTIYRSVRDQGPTGLSRMMDVLAGAGHEKTPVAPEGEPGQRPAGKMRPVGRESYEGPADPDRPTRTKLDPKPV